MIYVEYLQETRQFGCLVGTILIFQTLLTGLEAVAANTNSYVAKWLIVLNIAFFRSSIAENKL